MQQQAFQDLFVEDYSHCYGCGRLNENGLQIRTFWEGEESVTRFRPREYHIAVPGYVYGGLIASLVDCHGVCTATAAAHRAAGRELGSEPALRYVTASLEVDYLRPTPTGCELEIRGRVKELKGRKVVTEVSVLAQGELCARGEVVAVQIRDSALYAPGPS